MATERINFALASLRNELRELRYQDVAIMRQLLGINNTLNEMNKTQKKQNLNRKSQTTFTEKSRINSVLSDSNNSLSSVISEDESCASTTSRPLPTVAMTLPENEAELSKSQYYGILMTNVKLWKLSQSDDFSSDFSDQEEDV
ncbi:uncharacterized protein LOC134271622 [Saccostrea cucullata]|uniref:uncharacterized protein LOC134271622 n=1 Tax=Saccostrea cuccullata TaxID=36930 RepID=UPI002ED0B4C6